MNLGLSASVKTFANAMMKIADKILFFIMLIEELGSLFRYSKYFKKKSNAKIAKFPRRDFGARFLFFDKCFRKNKLCHGNGNSR